MAILSGTFSGDKIPKSSILWTGKRAVVYVKVPERESPSFLYREVTLGPEAGNFYVVADGLKEGEVIAVNGVFKIDAAAQLEGKPSMMNPGADRVSIGHDHGSMTSSESQSTALVQQVDKINYSTHQPGESDLHDVEFHADFKKQLHAVYDAYIIMTKAFGLQHGTVYYQYCPMANGDKGAYWLSDTKDIVNPYFGEKMLKCGETRETLDFSKK